MGNIDDCVRKFGKALSPNDVEAIRALGGDVAAAQQYIDQLTAERDGYFPPEQSLAQDGQRKVGIKADIGRLSSLLGPQLYGRLEDIGLVTVKELFQNAFDGVKDIPTMGVRGAIEIFRRDDVITVKDNGIGMTPDTVENAFLTVAGTQKSSDRASGGFGIAKMLFLFGNREISLETVHDGVRTRLNSTGAEIMEAASGEGTQLDLQIDNVSLPNGTTISVKIPESYEDPGTGEIKTIYMPAHYELEDLLHNSPLFEDIDVYLNDNPVNIGASFPKDDYTNYANVKFNWGNIRVIVSKERTDDSRYSPNVVTLSEGIFQFSDRLTYGPITDQQKIPYQFFFNIEPTVEPHEVGYPIAINRKGYSHGAYKDIERLIKYISSRYSLTDIADSSASFGTVEILDDAGVHESIDLTPKARSDSQQFLVNQGGEIVIEDGRMLVDGEEVPELTDEQMKEFVPDIREFKIDQSDVDPTKVFVHSNATLDGTPILESLRNEFGEEVVNKYFKTFGDVFMELRDFVHMVGGLDYAGIEDVPVGISFDEEYYGVHFQAPFRGMAINPGMSILDENDATFRATSIVTTMIHEIAHYKHMDHSPATFINENQRLMALILGHDDFNEINFSEMRDKLIDSINENEEIYERIRQGYKNGSVANSGTKLEESRWQPIGTARDDGGTQTDVGPGQSATTGVQQTTGPDTGRDTEGGLDGTTDSQPEGPFDDITGDIKSTKPVTLAQQAKRNEFGMYSKVEQAVLDMKLQEWKADKPAKGKVIWQKLKPGKAAGVTAEEVKFLGLEELLMADPNQKFSRQEVVDFVQANGVVIEETMAGEQSGDEDYQYDEIDWDEGYADTDSENWYHQVENDLYEYDRDPEEVSHWFSFEDWVKENLDDDIFQDRLEETVTDTKREEKGEQEFRIDIVEIEGGFTLVPTWVLDNQPMQNQANPVIATREEAETRARNVVNAQRSALGVPMYNRIDVTETTTKNEDVDMVLKDLIDQEEWTGVIQHIGLEVIAPEARDDFEKISEQQAEEQYMENPYKTYSANNTDNDNVEIFGNEDIGFTIQINGNHIDSEIWSLSEAQVQAEEAARERGIEIGEGGDARPSEDRPRWSEYIADGDSDNYREQKIKLPDIAEDFYHRGHFEDRNIVAFNRLTDRGGTQANGDPGMELRIEESQSDWDSQARKRGGYRSGADTTALQDEMDLIKGQVNELLDSIYDEPSDPWARNGEMEIDEARRTLLDGGRVWALTGPEGNDAFTVQPEQLDEVSDLGGKFYTVNPRVVNPAANHEEFILNAWSVIRGQDNRDTDLDSLNSPTMIGLALEDNQTLFTELRELVREFDQLNKLKDAELDGPANQPYKGNLWTNLALKFAIQEAIDGGYNQMAWNDNATIQGTWSPNYSYEAQYNNKMPSMVKKLTGQKARHVLLEGNGEPIPEKQSVEQVRQELEISQEQARDRLQEDYPIWVELHDPDGTIFKLADKVNPGRDTIATMTEDQIRRVEAANGRDTPAVKLEIQIEMRQNNLNEYIDSVKTDEGYFLKYYSQDYVTAHEKLSTPMGKWVIDINDDVKEKFAQRKSLFQEEVKPDRGEIILMDNERIIKLGAASDLSTFLHESMHLFIEVEKQFAAEYGVTPNNQAMMDFVNAASFDDINAITPEGIEKHEKLARAWEAYLREGKAPSLKLRDAFAAFKSWLLKIYQSATDLDVELNDSIREVFDRMLATEAEIMEQTATPAYESIYTQDDHPGMTDAEWETYQANVKRRDNRATETVDEKLMKEFLARRTKEWKEEREPLVEDEYARLSKEPVYQLMGDLTLAPFDYDLVMAALPEGSKLPGRLIGKARKEDGVDPAEYAEAYGYPSVVEMIDDLTSVPTLKAASEAAGQARMIDLHGDILNDGTLEAEIEEALHNDAQAEVLLAELKALKPKRKNQINRDFLKAEAKRIIGNMTFSQIQPNKYYRAEVRAAKRAGEARADMQAEIYDAKVSQLMNHYLYREAVETRAAMERHRRYVRGVQNRNYDVKAVNDEFIANMKALSTVYDMGSNPERQRERLNAILSWFNDQVAKGEVELQMMDPNLLLAMEARVRGEMSNFALPDFDSLTAHDLRGVYEMLRHLRFVGGQISEIQSSEIAAERAELTASINEHGGRAVKDPESIGRKAPAWDQVVHLANKLPSLRNLIRKLDGFGNDQGVANKLIYRLVEDAANDKLDITNRVYDDFQNELDAIHHIGLSRKDVSIITDAGNKATLNYEEIFVLALYWGTESSRDAIREGHGFSDNDVNELLSNLTTEQLEMVNAVWKINESIWPELSSASVKRYGVSPEKLDATPFEVNGVVMTGGHQRLFYNSLDIELANERKQGEQYATIMPTKAGSLYERIGSGGRPVLLDRNNIVRALEDSIHFIAFAAAGQHVRRLINAKDIQASIQSKHGVPFHRALVEQLDQLVRHQKPREAYPGLASAFRLLRRAATYRHLVLSIRNIMQQFSAIPIAASEVGTVDFINAAMTIYFDGGAAKDSILQRSAFMRNRTSFVNREAAEYLKQLSVDGPFATQWQRFASIGFTPQTFVDAQIAFPVWLAKYEQGMNTHGDDRRAISEGDSAVAESVGSGSDLHLGGAFHSNTTEFARTMTLFGSWFNAYYQRMYRETKGWSEASPAGFHAVATMPLMVGVLASVLVMDFPDDDDDESWWEYVLTRYAVFLSGTMPILRDVVSFAHSGFTPKTVLAGAQEGPGKIWSEVESFFEGRQSGLKMASDVAKTVTTFVPVPGSGEVTRVADFIDSYNQGNEGELTPLKVYQALVEGPDRNK